MSVQAADALMQVFGFERAELSMGEYTDDELANAVFMHDHRSFDIVATMRGEPGSIVLLTAAKDRIRWLSRSLDKALARLSDAQAIIDGLRGEVAQLQSMLATVSKAGLRGRTERDQQAQRIGEMEAELARITGLWELELGRAQKAEAGLFSAALSAGKDSDQ